MNLRRILQGVAVIFCIAFFSTDSAAQQAQLAGANQEGLIQLGSNHPFVVSNYVMDLSQLKLGSADEARQFFKKYIDEGMMSISFDMSKEQATIVFNLNTISQGTGNQVSVARMNEKLMDVHRLRR
jgi:hypothetical protein